MRSCKRIAAAVLMVVFMVCSMAIPTFAAGALVQNAYAQFPTIRQSSNYAPIHVAFQRFLQGYGGESEAYLLNAEKTGMAVLTDIMDIGRQKRWAHIKVLDLCSQMGLQVLPHAGKSQLIWLKKMFW